MIVLVPKKGIWRWAFYQVPANSPSLLGTFHGQPSRLTQAIWLCNVKVNDVTSRQALEKQGCCYI